MSCSARPPSLLGKLHCERRRDRASAGPGRLRHRQRADPAARGAAAALRARAARGAAANRTLRVRAEAREPACAHGGLHGRPQPLRRRLGALGELFRRALQASSSGELFRRALQASSSGELVREAFENAVANFGLVGEVLMDIGSQFDMWRRLLDQRAAWSSVGPRNSYDVDKDSSAALPPAR